MRTFKLKRLICLVFAAAMSVTALPASVTEAQSGSLYIHSTYESGTDNWSARGGNNVAVSSSAAFAGEKSLYVSGRTDSWNGAGYTLDTSVFQPGQSYSFCAQVMQREIETESFKLSLQYDVSGETSYASIAENTGDKGKWTRLANESFMIPQGAENLLLYVETAENLTSFYVDEASCAAAGTVISPVPNPKTGDSDMDGNLGNSDIEALQNWLIEKNDNVSFENSDLDGSGSLDSFDLVLLRKLVLDPPAEPEPEPEPEPEQPVVEGQWYNTADISWIDPNKPMVAISFDDGPVGIGANDYSIRIQNALADNGFHATFFYSINLWGRYLDSTLEQEIIRAHELGFEVANHTYSHPDLSNKTAEYVQEEIGKCKEVLTRLTGQENFLIRPPYLSVDSNVQANAGAPLITCAIDSKDWDGASSQQIINTITTAMNNGTLDNAVVLMHETYDSTATAMEYLAPYLKQQGWQIVTVSEMFKVNGREMYDGQVYARVQ